MLATWNRIWALQPKEIYSDHSKNFHLQPVEVALQTVSPFPSEEPATEKLFVENWSVIAVHSGFPLSLKSSEFHKPLSLALGSPPCLQKTHQDLPWNFNSDLNALVPHYHTYLQVNFNSVKFMGDVFDGSRAFSKRRLLLSQGLSDLCKSMEAS